MLCVIINKFRNYCIKLFQNFDEPYYLIESRNIEIFESINVHGSKKTKRKIESKVKKKNIAIRPRNGFILTK